MNDSVFFQARFVLLVVFSVVLPVAIYAFMLATRAISRRAVLLFGIALIALAGVDVVLLQGMATLARLSLSAVDDLLFNSEVSVALYLLPAVFAGIGTNVVSHILVRHLVDAERQFDKEHPDARQRPG